MNTDWLPDWFWDEPPDKPEHPRALFDQTNATGTLAPPVRFLESSLVTTPAHGPTGRISDWQPSPHHLPKKVHTLPEPKDSKEGAKIHTPDG